MQNLLKQTEALKKSPVKKQIDQRILEFKKVGQASNNTIFKELCFCILTANSTAQRCIEVQAKVGNGFLNLLEKDLQKLLKTCGARFHTKRAGYIFEARKHKNQLKKLMGDLDEFEMREWLVENIKGFGWKEASHFLRNIGYENVAIIDFHIVDLLENQGVLKRPKTLNGKTYLQIENKLKKIGDKTGLNLAELDLYLWYLETGKILK